MNKATKKVFLLGLLTLLIFIFKANAQDAADAGVKRFCDGETVSYNDAASTIPADYTPKLYYSAIKIDIPTTDPATVAGITTAVLTGTTIQNPKTGYYYLKGVPADAAKCETAYQEIVIYIFKPLSIDFVALNYCNKNTPLAQVSTPVSTDKYTTFGYQWYKLDASGGEVKLTSSSASTKDYTPVAADGLVAGTNKIRVKAGYNISGTGNYCVTSKDHDIVISTAPNALNVTVTGATPITY